MKPAIFLRIASVLTIVHALLHTIGGVYSSPDPGPQSVAVTAMKANQFLLMGHMRSYFDFYRGMGLAATISLTAEGIIMWQLGNLVKTAGVRLRPVLGTFLLAYTVMSVNSNAHFFWGPVVAEILIAACFLGAMVTAKAPVVIAQQAHA